MREPHGAQRNAARIDAERCARTYGSTVALRSTDLAIEAGETLVILGPSGCGKTTLLRILAGLDRPDAGGRVLFDGEDVTERPIERRDVGMVFQSYALFPNMTVAGNVAYGPRVAGLSRRAAAEKARTYLALCRIETLAERRIDQLSGGQRQRVALARALAAEPRAIFLDEPLTALDAALRDTLRAEIAGVLSGLDITAIYVTHDQVEAMALADRLVVMNDGAIEQVGSPRAVYEAPATRFVAEFVGDTNRLAWTGGRTAYFRPEAARLCEVGRGRPGRVAAVTYLGARMRVSVDVDGQPVLIFVPGRSDVQVGDSVCVAVDETRLMTFD